jgi:hypothetical protein
VDFNHYSEIFHLTDIGEKLELYGTLYQLFIDFERAYAPGWWPGVKNSSNVAHACRKKRLK